MLRRSPLLISVLLLITASLLSACASLQPSPQPELVIPPTSTPQPVIPTPVPAPTSTPIPPLNSPVGPPLRTLRMFNEKDGFGLIYNSLLLTHDGGLTWFSVPLPQGQVNQDTRIFFSDINNFYLVVPAPNGQGGQLCFTYNGGEIGRAHV